MSANAVKPLISMRKVAQAGNVVVLDEKNPRIRNNRDGMVIKLDVNSGVYTMDMWVCLDETGLVFIWQGLWSGSSVTNKPARPRTKCSSESEESYAEQELNCLEEGEDAMTDEEGAGVEGEGEGEAGTTDWRVRAGPNKQTDCKRKGRTRCNRHAVPRLVHTLHDRQRSHSSPRVEEKK